MVRATLLVIWGGVTVALFLPVTGNSEQIPPPNCQSLPKQGAANTASVHVAKAFDAPGVVCIRVINGLNVEIATGGPLVRLQKWESGWLGKGQFRNFPEPAPKGGDNRIYTHTSLFSSWKNLR